MEKVNGSNLIKGRDDQKDFWDKTHSRKIKGQNLLKDFSQHWHFITFRL